MASLLDRIQQIGQPQAAPSQAGIEQIMRARSGKAGGGSGPAASNLGEQAAIQAGKSALQEQTFAERLQGTQLQGAETATQEGLALQQQQMDAAAQLKQDAFQADVSGQRSNLQASEAENLKKLQAGESQNIKKLNHEAEKSLRDMASMKQIQLDDIFSQFEASSKELAYREDAAQLEQLGTRLALQDSQYLSELGRIGQENNLMNEMAYKEETARLIYGSQLKEFLADINFSVSTDADQRKFNEQLAKIGPDVALQIAIQAGKDDAQRQQWQAGTQVVKAGVEYKYGK